jgi:hypothetical protein
MQQIVKLYRTRGEQLRIPIVVQALILADKAHSLALKRLDFQGREPPRACGAQQLAIAEKIRAVLCRQVVGESRGAVGEEV